MADELHYFGPSSYSPPSTAAFDAHPPMTDMTLGESSHHLDSHSPPDSSEASATYNINNSSANQLEFHHPTSSPFTHHSHSHSFSDVHQSPVSHVNHASHQMTLNPAQLNSNIGPSRVRTRRQARAAQQQAAQQDIGAPMQPSLMLSDIQTDQGMENQPQGFYISNEVPRPDTPSSYNLGNQYAEQSDMTIGPTGLPIPPSMASPPHPSTPASTSSSNFSNRVYHPYHSRSTSSSTNPRSNSPAMSVISTATSFSSSSSGRPPPPPYSDGMSPLDPRSKQKKQRLFNVDRKAICVYSQDNPNARQEDIASRWGVERSTISKILKHKTKWLSIPAGEELKVAKHRPSKFPEIEFRLQRWLSQCKEESITITDSMIRTKAKDAAKDMGIGEEKFKASAGWVENFKHRHGIRKGIWTGDGRNRHIAIAMGCLAPPREDEDDHPLAVPLGTDDHDSVMDSLDDGHRGDMGPPNMDAGMDMDTGSGGQFPLGQGNGLEPSPMPRTQWEQQTEQQYQSMTMNTNGSYQESVRLTPASQDPLTHPGTDGNEQVRGNDAQQMQTHVQTVVHESDILPHNHAEQNSASAQDISQLHLQNALIDAGGPYHPIPDLQAQHLYEDRLPLAEEANQAMDIVLAWTRKQGPGYLEDHEYHVLTGIKQRIFCSAADLPDARAASTRPMTSLSTNTWAP